MVYSAQRSVIGITALRAERMRPFNMTHMQKKYEIVRRIEDDQIISVATQSDLQAAVQLIESLNAEWPGNYSIREGSTGSRGQHINVSGVSQNASR
jgi:hypothetical protein